MDNLKNMKKLEPTKIYLMDKRNEIILDLHNQGFSSGDISEIINLDRTWIFRIIKILQSEQKKTTKTKRP